MTNGHDAQRRHAPVAAGADLADQLHSAAIHLLRQLRKEDDASGLSAPRLSALSVVVFGGPLTLGELARAEQVKPPTMTRIVTGLEKEGLVKRKDDPSDGRLTHIEATAKGRKILVAGRARRVQRLASAVGRLEAAELAELRRGVQLVSVVVASMRGDSPRSSEERK
ncbi:MAG TPA: MarR family transcriptional regulator [Casimicrobiaceae bacterium]|nr:MarR family transcriptional regulator [Casimicrobiaceae bacterium]